MSLNKNWLIGATLILSLVALGVATFKPSVKLSEEQITSIAQQVGSAMFGSTGTRFPNGLSTDTTSPSAGQIRGTLLTITGTTTLTESVDGLVIGGTISTAATGTVRTLDTNTTGPKACDASRGHLVVRNKGLFSPSLQFSVGTSTSAIQSTNLIASTTIATSTPGTTFFYSIAPSASLFVYKQGDVLTAMMGDITNSLASSTNYSNLTVEFGMWCQDLSI